MNSKSFVYLGAAWVVFSFVLGIMLVMTPASRSRTAGSTRDAQPSQMGYRQQAPRPDAEPSTLKTTVDVKGTPGSEGTTVTSVQVKKGR